MNTKIKQGDSLDHRRATNQKVKAIYYIQVSEYMVCLNKTYCKTEMQFFKVQVIPWQVFKSLNYS